MIFSIQIGIINIILKKVKGLWESKEKNDVNHTERKHVSRYHAEDHRNEWPSQLDRPGMENTYNTPIMFVMGQNIEGGLTRFEKNPKVLQFFLAKGEESLFNDF